MKKICIVDDYEINLFVLDEYLKENYEIIKFNNAKKCIEYLEDNEIKLVLMDCYMPFMDGHEATKIIKQKLNNVKVIGVTADPFDDNIEKCKISGMDDIIIKPIIKKNLIEIIDKYI